MQKLIMKAVAALGAGVVFFTANGWGITAQSMAQWMIACCILYGIFLAYKDYESKQKDEDE